jgi:hypothetical protein
VMRPPKRQPRSRELLGGLLVFHREELRCAGQTEDVSVMRTWTPRVGARLGALVCCASFWSWLVCAGFRLLVGLPRGDRAGSVPRVREFDNPGSRTGFFWPGCAAKPGPLKSVGPAPQGDFLAGLAACWHDMGKFSVSSFFQCV